MRVHGRTMTVNGVCVCVCVCEKGKLERVCVHGHTMTVDAMRASLCPRVHNDSQGHVCEKHDKLDRVCVPPPHTHTQNGSQCRESENAQA